MKLKKYNTHQKTKLPKKKTEPSGVACDEKKCKGEMMIQLPIVEHYSEGRAGEPGAVKSDLRRAVCDTCGWNSYSNSYEYY